jgi:hypothetical protein
VVDISDQLSLSLSLSLFFSLSLYLVKEGFSFGNLRKSSNPITAIKKATQENLGAS